MKDALSSRERYYAQSTNDSRHYRRWTPGEIAVVLRKAMPDPVLADRLGRTIKAIQEARRRNKK